ncbi:Fur family transcriptional regulator [Leeia aquatica]|uniref:Fur family transcriptional regulator n=1 Tax=Leeia aquatica TaxID=2725557 RepID=UPI0019817BD7|nr:Fur family transcriptional regulator [Leeia aquatica]
MSADLDAESLLRRTGERVTPARRRILALLLASPTALSQQELLHALADGPAIDRVTVYRVLEWLSEKGLAHKIAGEDRIWRFNAASHRIHQHAHFQCQRCQRVYCLEHIQIDWQPQLPDGFRLHHADITLKGDCPSCSR